MTMSSRNDGHIREWLGPFASDRRQERRIARARRKVVAEREVLEVTRRPVSRGGICAGPHDHCSHLLDEDRY